jgi:ATP-dependent DNA helicase HFM1/MER3
MSLKHCIHRGEHEQTLSQIQLFLIDEVSGHQIIVHMNAQSFQVHILNENRGSTLEVIVSRMKTRGTSVRFVMVSATVPNVQDVASWVGNSPRSGPAIVMEVSIFFA